MNCWQRKNNFTVFQQESTPVAEKEALPGSTSRQDGEPDRKPGAHGEWSEDLTDTSCGGATVRLTVPLFSTYFRSKTWSSLRLKRKSSMGWKLEMNVWKKCTRLAMLNSCVMRHALCITGYWWVSPTLGDVYWRSRTDYGWNPRFHRIPKGKSPTDEAFIQLFTCEALFKVP